MEEKMLVIPADWGDDVCIRRIHDAAEFHLSIDEAKELIQRLPKGIEDTKVAARMRAEDKVAKCETRLEEARKALDELIV